MEWTAAVVPMARQLQWLPRTSFNMQPQWGSEGSGAGFRAPVALLSEVLSQRPGSLITILVFISRVGSRGTVLWWSTFCFSQLIPEPSCNFKPDRGFLFLFTVYWQSIRCFIGQMLLSAQLCSAVTASEDVSVGTHTRVSSDVKACLWMHLFMPFKRCKSKRNTRGLGGWQTSCYRVKNRVLCVARTAKGEEEWGSQAAYLGGQKPHWRSKPNFWARVRQGTNGTLPPANWAPPSFQAWMLFSYSHLFFLLPLPFTFIHSLSTHPLCARPRDLLCVQEATGSLTRTSPFPCAVFTWGYVLQVA